MPFSPELSTMARPPGTRHFRTRLDQALFKLNGRVILVHHQIPITRWILLKKRSIVHLRQAEYCKGVWLLNKSLLKTALTKSSLVSKSPLVEAQIVVYSLFFQKQLTGDVRIQNISKEIFVNPSTWPICVLSSVILNYSTRVCIQIGHFRITSSLFLKAILGAQPFIWKWDFIHMQIKFIFMWLVLHQVSL